MIITQTPYRISFAGGGTDLPAYYHRRPGAVLSVTFDRHIYVTVHRRFEANFRLAYTRTEFASKVEEIEHTLIREALLLTGIREPLEVTTIGDAPAGTGLGSSSSLTVGLLAAFYASRGKVVSPDRLAAEACRIEIDILGKPIGRQDQYAAAFGGINLIRFYENGSVQVEQVACAQDTYRALESHMLLIYTNVTRNADEILDRQQAATNDHFDTLTEMARLAEVMRVQLNEGAPLQEFGRLLHEGWLLKRSLGCGITSSGVDDWYGMARENGAWGGKLLGAGGGGFLLVLAPPEQHERILAALKRPRALPVHLTRLGSRVVFMNDN